MVSNNLDKVEVGLAVNINRAELEKVSKHLIDTTELNLLETLKLARLQADNINTVFLTGGTAQIPAIQHMIHKVFAKAKFIYGDVFGSVGKGLALESYEVFGR
jgi:hypothetical chaperone protein